MKTASSKSRPALSLKTLRSILTSIGLDEETVNVRRVDDARAQVWYGVTELTDGEFVRNWTESNRRRALIIDALNSRAGYVVSEHDGGQAMCLDVYFSRG